MKSREKMLLIGLIATIALWQGYSLISRAILAPLDERANRIRSLKTAVSQKTAKEREVLQAAGRIKEWTARSLPPDPVAASAMYQNWLLELTAKCRLSDPKVKTSHADARSAKAAFVHVTADVQARGTQEHIGQFLDAVSRSGLLHRVENLSIKSSLRETNPTLDMSLKLQGLAMPSAPARTTLFAVGTPEVAPAPFTDRPEYATLSSKNLFTRGLKPPAVPPPAPPPIAPPPPGLDEAAYVFLVGAVIDGEKRDAWLYDRVNNRETILIEGKGIQVAGVQGTVVKIERDFILLRVNNDDFRLELGQHLRQMQKLTTTPPPATSSPPATTSAAAAGPQPIPAASTVPPLTSSVP